MSASYRQLGGQIEPESWGGQYQLGDQSDIITVEVNNVLIEKKINNVFGVIKGFVDAGKIMSLIKKMDNVTRKLVH